jgi:hypothetical protein
MFYGQRTVAILVIQIGDCTLVIVWIGDFYPKSIDS